MSHFQGKMDIFPPEIAYLIASYLANDERIATLFPSSTCACTQAYNISCASARARSFVKGYANPVRWRLTLSCTYTPHVRILAHVLKDIPANLLHEHTHVFDLLLFDAQGCIRDALLTDDLTVLRFCLTRVPLSHAELCHSIERCWSYVSAPIRTYLQTEGYMHSMPR